MRQLLLVRTYSSSADINQSPRYVHPVLPPCELVAHSYHMYHIRNIFHCHQTTAHACLLSACCLPRVCAAGCPIAVTSPTVYAVERDLAQAKGYHCVFTHCTVPRKASYSGVATFIRSDSGLKTLASTKSLADADFFGSCRNAGSFSGGLTPERLGALDSEGRVLVTDHGHFVLFNVYAPCTRCDASSIQSVFPTLPTALRNVVYSVRLVLRASLQRSRFRAGDRSLACSFIRTER